MNALAGDAKTREQVKVAFSQAWRRMKGKVEKRQDYVDGDVKMKTSLLDKAKELLNAK